MSALAMFTFRTFELSVVFTASLAFAFAPQGLRAESISVEGITVPYKFVGSASDIEFQVPSNGYRNTYYLNCDDQRFLWLRNEELSTGKDTGNAYGAEWRKLNPQSTIANAIFSAACPPVKATAPAPVLEESTAEIMTQRGLDSILPDSGPLLTRLQPSRATPSAQPVDVYTFAPVEWGRAAVSPDGRYVASVGGGGVCLWQTDTAMQLRCYRVPPGPVLFDKEGNYLIVAKGPANRGHVSTTVFNLSPEGAHEESNVTLLSVEKDMPIRLLKGQNGDAFSAAVSPDGNLLYVGHYNNIAVWNLADQKMVRVLPCSGVAFNLYPEHDLGLCSKNFSNLLAANQGREADDYTIQGVKLSTGTEVVRFRGATQPVTAAELTTDGSTLYSVSRDGRIREYHSGTGLLKSTITVVPDPKIEFTNSVGDVIEGILFMLLLPDNRHAVIRHELRESIDATNEWGRATTVWDLKQGVEIRALPEAEEPLALMDSQGHAIVGTDGYMANEGRSVRLDQGNVDLRFVGFVSKVKDIHVRGAHTVLYSAASRGLLVDLHTGSASPVLDVSDYSQTFVSDEGNRAVVVDAVGAREGFDSGQSRLRITSYKRMIDSLPGIQREKSFEITSNRQGKVWSHGDSYPVNVGLAVASISPDGGLVVTTSDDGYLEVWDVEAGTRVRAIRHPAWSIKYTNSGCGLSNAVLSPHRRYIASVEVKCDGVRKGVLRIWDFDTGREVAAFDIGGVSKPSFYQDRGDLVFSPLGEEVALLTTEDPNPFDRPAKAVLHVFSAHRQMISMPMEVEAFGAGVRWSAEDNELVVTGVVPRKDNRHYEDMTRSLLRVVIVSKVDGSVRETRDMDGAPSGTACSGRFKVLPGRQFAVDCDAIWNPETGQRLASFFPLAGGEEWMFLTPEGFYSSSENAHKYVKMRRGNEVYGAEQLYDVFYRPDLVIRKLRGEDISGDSKLLTIDQALANPPPVAEILALEPKSSGGGQEVRYRLQGKGGGIGEVRIYHKGKLAHRQDVKIAGEGSHEGTVRLKGEAGDNEVTVMGMNQQNSVEGMKRSRNFTVAGEASPPHVYVLAVGISQYRSGKDNLTFAVSDAQRLAAALEKGLGSLYHPEHVHIELVADAQATREGLLARFAKLKEVVQPGDQFILYFASHGLLSDGKYYIVAHDYDGTFDPSKGLSSEEVMEASREISALHQLLIFDTCHAGGMDQTVTATYDARMSVLARQMGLHVFSAASSLQKAVEGYEGSGVFTHALLEALSQGATMDSNQDGVVSIAEVGSYVKQRTEAIALSVGYRQTPRIINVGQDKGLYRFGAGPQIVAVTSGGFHETGQRSSAKPLRITTGAGVSLRSAPSRTASKHDLLHFGTVVTLLGEETQAGETWNRVSTADGEGWIPATYLSWLPPNNSVTW